MTHAAERTLSGPQETKRGPSLTPKDASDEGGLPIARNRTFGLSDEEWDLHAPLSRITVYRDGELWYSEVFPAGDGTEIELDHIRIEIADQPRKGLRP